MQADLLLKCWNKEDKVKIDATNKTITELRPVEIHVQAESPIVWIVMDGTKRLRTFGRLNIDLIKPVLKELAKSNPDWFK